MQAVTYPLTWRWSNPTPHGANIVDLAFSSGLGVQVGERGQIFTSTDFSSWTPRDSHTTRSLRGVTFFGGRIVISGESGTILFADDATEFYLNDLGTSDWLESVAASTNLVVAVGDNGAIYTSDDAVTWTRKTTSFTTWLRGVAWGPPGFVAVGENGFIANSASGNIWMSGQPPFPAPQPRGLVRRSLLGGGRRGYSSDQHQRRSVGTAELRRDELLVCRGR